MRNRFDEQLDNLNVELIKMGALCEEAISTAVKAFLDNDSQMAEKAIAADEEIDRKERDIEALCMKLLLSQQPVARDLRVISSAMKMISDMERIGDQASDISEISEHMQDSPDTAKVHIRDMALASIKMVTESIDSFVEKDLNKVNSVIEYDDIVDELFSRVRDEIISLVSTQQIAAEMFVDMLMTAKYLERIADHAVNIAEWVEYSITGNHVER